MNRFRFTLNTLAVLFFTLMVTTLAQAQAARTWVSGNGNDFNTCTTTAAPCRTFAGALAKTAAGGEISVFAPGDFGPVTINTAITIDGGSIGGSITAAFVNGIVVSAGGNDTVRLRNLSINGIGSGINGIRYLSGRNLVVENVTIQDFTTNGIDVNLGFNNGNLAVKDSYINNCGVGGVRMQTTTGTATASLDRVRLQFCQFGLDLFSGSIATISNSVVSQNLSIGIVAENATVINVESTVVSNNSTGVSGFSGTAIIRLSNTDIFNNTTGISIAAGTVVASYQNNRIAGNITPGAPNVLLTQQ